MVKHIVLWRLKEELSGEEKKAAALKIKELLEPLKESIPGVISIKVVTEPLATSTIDLALVSEYESTEALANYAVHPLHVEAGKYIKSVTCHRECLDY